MILARLFLVSVCVFLFSVSSEGRVRYEPTWESLDTRPIPQWFDEAKIGIFLHWGVFSVPSFGGEWFWAYWKGNYKDIVEFMEKNYPKGYSYQEFAKDFTAEFFNATEWAQIFEKAGAKYVVITSKHHEGYTLWPSKYSFSWNAKDIGPHRDLIGELSSAVKNSNMHFGVYHSLYEWYNPIYLADRASNFTKSNFVTQKMIPEMAELVQNYRPDVLWSDGDWEARDTYWQSTKFLAWLYNESPVKDTILVNDRWGIDIPCKHGDFYSCKDRYNPGVLQEHKWENAMTLDRSSWGFRRNAKLSDYLTMHELITTLAQTISCGGNLLINVGPTKDGIIAPIFQQRLSDLGTWLSINGEAIYGSTPWKVQNDTLGETWYTSKSNNVYAITLSWPKNDVLKLGSAINLFNSKDIKVGLLGTPADLEWRKATDSIEIHFPDKATAQGDWAWVVKISK